MLPVEKEVEASKYNGSIYCTLKNPEIVESLLPKKPISKNQVHIKQVTDLSHFDLKPIGSLESVFREKFGTPK